MTRSQSWGFVLLATVLLLTMTACGGGSEEPAASPEAADTAPAAAPAAGGSASITGSVQAAGAEDADLDIKMDADPVCAGLHEHAVQTETVLTDASGNLANAFVYVKSGLSGSFPAPEAAAVISQRGCVYAPHVSGMMVGQTLKIVNEDPTLHNVHASPNANPEFNQAQPFQGMELERNFESTEVMIPFKCDVHPWMSTYLAVLDHPFFAVSAADGSFSIGGLPAGTYTLEVWHETLGTQTSEVTVEDGGSAEVAFSFGA